MTTKFWKVPFKIEGEVEVAAETEELAFNRVTHHMDIGEIAEHGDLITYPAEFDAQTGAQQSHPTRMALSVTSPGSARTAGDKAPVPIGATPPASQFERCA